MLRFVLVSILSSFGMSASFLALAENPADGMVIEHAGDVGELIVSRDGIVYWLSTGDDLFVKDTIRSQNADAATISFNGCVLTLPEKKDVTLDDEFCSAIVADVPTMAQVASEQGATSTSALLSTSANAPLIVGGVVLSAGGLAAAADGGSGGTDSVTSDLAGAPEATSDP